MFDSENDAECEVDTILAESTPLTPSRLPFPLLLPSLLPLALLRPQHEGNFALKEAWYHVPYEDYDPFAHERSPVPNPVVFDLNGDGQKEVVFASRENKIQVTISLVPKQYFEFKSISKAEKSEVSGHCSS